MQLSHRNAGLVRARAPAALAQRRPVIRLNALNEKLPVDPAPVVGERLAPWLTTVGDLLAFPARAAAGALVSAPERLQTLQTDVQRLVELAQDPRPVEEKQEVLRKELETTVLEFLEKGVVVEQDVLTNLKTVLPAEAAQLLEELVPEPPNKGAQAGPVVAVDPVDLPEEPLQTYGQQDVYTQQIESEISEIRKAVAGLKSALDSMRTNTDASASSVLRLTLRDARDQLARRLTEVSPATAQDPSVAAATREAGILLEEVDAMFYSS